MSPDVQGQNLYRQVSIEECRKYFIKEAILPRTSIITDSINWDGFELIWDAADEVVLLDSSTVVIVPIADSAILVDPYLDAYTVFFEDSSDSIRWHILMFQADSASYGLTEDPSLQNFDGFIWEFDFRMDSFAVYHAIDGIVVSKGCSQEFGEYATNLEQGVVQARTQEPKCYKFGPRFIDIVWGGISGYFGFPGYFSLIQSTWKVLAYFFSNSGKPNTPGALPSWIGYTPNGNWPSAFGFGAGLGNGGGGGSGIGINLNNYFTEWEIKQIQKAAIWLDNTYGIEFSATELYLNLGQSCTFELMEFLENPPGPSMGEDETLGPQCVQDFAVEWLLELFPWLTEEDEIEIYYLLLHEEERTKLASYTSGDQERTENMKEYISLEIGYSPFNVDRFIDIWNLLEDDPNILSNSCIGENEEYDIEFWSLLASFNPPQSVHNRIIALGDGWILQSFTTPTLAPHINLDYFSINISLMPIKNEQTGERWLPDDFLEYIRKNINLFVDTEASEFTPYRYPSENYDFNLWNSSNPITTVISIEIPADDGSVICAKSEDDNWIFSTLKAPLFPLSEDGFHPVSGNRQFGYTINTNQSITLYTKGADRVFYPPNAIGGNSILAYLTQKAAFSGADALWNSFQVKTSAYVISHGGVASIVPPVKHRPKAKDALRQLLSSNTPVSTQNLCGN